VRDISGALILAQRAVDASGRRHPRPLLTLALTFDAAGHGEDAEAVRAEAAALCAGDPALARFCDESTP
jgi:hypothetical protein